MASTQIWQEYNTSSSSYTVMTNMNFGSSNTANMNTALYPINANSYSYEKWIKVQFNDVTNPISDIKLYKSSGSYVTGETLKFGCTTTFETPTNSQSSVATTTMPTSEPDNANITIGGSLSGSITTSEETTDFIVTQANFDQNTSAGESDTKTFTLSWTETL